VSHHFAQLLFERDLPLIIARGVVSRQFRSNNSDKFLAGEEIRGRQIVPEGAARARLATLHAGLFKPGSPSVEAKVSREIVASQRSAA
jgi:hypothetical protein